MLMSVDHRLCSDDHPSESWMLTLGHSTRLWSHETDQHSIGWSVTATIPTWVSASLLGVILLSVRLVHGECFPVSLYLMNEQERDSDMIGLCMPLEASPQQCKQGCCDLVWSGVILPHLHSKPSSPILQIKIISALGLSCTALSCFWSSLLVALWL